jgi:phosphonate transport system substrate-binding protein
MFAAMAAFAALGPALPARADRPVSFGLTPVFLDSDIKLLADLNAYLTRRLGQPVELVKRRTYQEITAMLLTGQLDAAWVCDDPYVQYQDQLALLAVPLYHHEPLYQCYVVVHETSKAQNFDDVRGTVHAFSDPDSTSGYLNTRYLLALRKTTPADFFRSFFFTYGHRNVIRAVAAGLAESGSVDGYVWDVMKEREPEFVKRTRVVYRSEWLGFPPVVGLQTMRDTPLSRAIASALLDMSSDRLGRDVLETLALDGFTTARPSLYHATMDKWRLVKAQV